MSWISVKKRLPKRYGWYLTYVNDEFNDGYKLLWFEDITNKFAYESSVEYKITHWQPLPKPPKNNLHYKK